MVLGDDLVARAVAAHRLAERNVHVQRQRRHAARHSASGAPLQRLLVVADSEGLDESVGCRVRGGAWAANVQLAQLRLGRGDLFAVGNCCVHAETVPNAPKAILTSRNSVAKPRRSVGGTAPAKLSVLPAAAPQWQRDCASRRPVASMRCWSARAPALGRGSRWPGSGWRNLPPPPAAGHPRRATSNALATRVGVPC